MYSRGAIPDVLAPHKLPNYLAILGASSPGLNRFAGLLPDPPKGNAEIRTATKNMILRPLPYAYKDGCFSLFVLLRALHDTCRAHSI